MHNSRLVQYRLSRLRSTGQAKEKEERGSMKDSFRVGRVQLSLHSVEREIGETLGSSSKNSPLYFSIKNSLSILSRCILDTLETVSKYDVKGREIKKKIKKGGASELPRADGWSARSTRCNHPQLRSFPSAQPFLSLVSRERKNRSLCRAYHLLSVHFTREGIQRCKDDPSIIFRSVSLSLRPGRIRRS